MTRLRHSRRQFLLLPLALLVAAPSPSEATGGTAETDIRPPGYWERALFLPCGKVPRQEGRRLFVNNLDEAAGLLHNAISTVGAQVANPTCQQWNKWASKDSHKSWVRAMVVWIDSEQLGRIDCELSSIGRLQKESGDWVPVKETAEVLAQKSRILREELEINQESLAKFPMALALVQEELRRLKSHESALRQASGRVLLTLTLHELHDSDPSRNSPPVRKICTP